MLKPRLNVLIDNSKMGDIIYLLPVVKCLSIPVSLFIKPWRFSLWDGIFILLESQNYILESRRWKEQHIDRHLEWRSHWRKSVKSNYFEWNIAYNMLKCFGLPTHHADFPWIQVEPKKENRVIINRSFNYRNKDFPWSFFLQNYDDVVFVGLFSEYENFLQFGKVPYRPVKDCLELAQLIAGSELFIGNQSMSYALAESLKVNTIQETDFNIPNCVFERDNAFYYNINF
jgi:hypothetical protein